MATKRVSLLNSSINPDSSGNVFFEPFTVKATNDVWDYIVTIFNDVASLIGLNGQAAVPMDYAGTPKIIVVWSATVTSGGVRWRFDYRAVGGDDAESLDQAGTQESVAVTDAAPSAAHERMEAQLALTAGNLAAADCLQWKLYRDGNHGEDDMAAAAIVHDLLLEYTD